MSDDASTASPGPEQHHLNWVVILHTIEDVACEIMDLLLGHIKVTQKRYLAGAGFYSSISQAMLGLIVFVQIVRILTG